MSQPKKEPSRPPVKPSKQNPDNKPIFSDWAMI